MRNKLQYEKLRIFLSVINSSCDDWVENDIRDICSVLEKTGSTKEEINSLLVSSFDMDGIVPFEFNGRFKILYNFIYFIIRNRGETSTDIYYRMAFRLKYSIYEAPTVIRIITNGIKEKVPEKTIQESLQTCIKSTRVFMSGF